MAFPTHPDPRPLLQRPLRRPHSPRLIGGVCAGLARWLGWDRAVVRLAFALLALATSLFPAVVLYGVLWLAIPEANEGRYSMFELEEF
jgi:phage shock protein PspC (stress-responsive transcriptional regulator)